MNLLTYMSVCCNKNRNSVSRFVQVCKMVLVGITDVIFVRRMGNHENYFFLNLIYD